MSKDPENEQKTFLVELEKLNKNDVLYHRENLSLSFLIDPQYCADTEEEHLTESFQAIMKHRAERGAKPLQGRDLDGVKHFSHSDLEAFTHDVEQKCVFGKNSYGRFISGKIQNDSGILDVTIKTWDLLYPLTRTITSQHPLRLHNEIMLLTNEPLKSDPRVPKLIGYSIHKTLAVVYDLKSKTTLRDALKNGSLGWDVRLNVAVQVAQLLKNLHCNKITIGSIDPVNILMNEEGNIKLCEFGLCARMQEVKAEEFHSWAGGIYSWETPELRDAGQQWIEWRVRERKGEIKENEDRPDCLTPGKWTVETDIFAFGSLLMELITKEPVDPVALYQMGSSLSIWASEVLGSGQISVLHEFLIDDADTRSKITELVLNCWNKAPDKRWKADTIARKLEDLKQGSESKKPKLDTC